MDFLPDHWIRVAGDVTLARHKAATQPWAMVLLSVPDCSPCIKVKQAIDGLAQRLPPDVALICCELGPDQAASAGVRHFPTLLLLRRGVEVAVARGGANGAGGAQGAFLARWLEDNGLELGGG